MKSTKLYGVSLLAAALLTGLSGLVPVAATAATAPVSAAALHRSTLDRVQLHNHALRGLPYVPLARTGAPVSHAPIGMRPFKIIRLDGDATTNVRSNVYPIDVDGDGRMELLQLNGERLIQVLRQDGTRLWRVTNPRGRVHRSNVHRDTAAVFDADGDGRQEVAHCWTNARGRSELVLRDGLSGKIERAIELDALGDACQIAGIHFAGEARPRLFVAHKARSSDGCWRTYTDYFSRTVVFDAQLRKLGERATCEAGHYAWPLDGNHDGYAEAVFVGKYLLERDGKVRCILPGWKRDHVDSLATADIDPAKPGHEVVAAGLTGTRFYGANNCRPIWTIPAGELQNPQWVVLARLDAGSTALDPGSRQGAARRRDGAHRRQRQDPTLLSRQRHQELRRAERRSRRRARHRRGGRQLRQGLGRAGRLRLDTSWYWNLQAKPKGAVPVYDEWAYAPLLVDLDRDGKEEMVVWGRDRLVIGKRR